MRQNEEYRAVDADLCDSGRGLLRFLTDTRGRFSLFGHQGDGEIRRAQNSPSDVLEATGAFPAVFGFDLSGIERVEYDPIARARIAQVKTEIRESHARGGIVTLCWHSANPLTGLGYGQNLAPGSVRAVLPGGMRHVEFLAWLGHVADFLTDLHDDAGTSIPVVFRPLHEHNGDWFWWCIGGSASSDGSETASAQGRCETDYDNHRGVAADASPEEFAELWRMIVSYLRDTRDVHNLLYALSPDRSAISLDHGAFAGDYLLGYPGDDMVDVLGLDDYIDIGREDNSGTPEEVFRGFVRSLEELAALARSHGKLAAMTEVGTPNALAGAALRPWTGFLDHAASATEATRQVLWYLTWTNSWHDEPNIYGTPLSSDPTGPDFRDMKERGFIRFLDRLPMDRTPR